MAKTKLAIIRQVEKHPISGKTALRMLLSLGCKIAAEMLSFDSEDQQETLDRLAPDKQHENAVIKNIWELVKDIASYDHEFIFDLMALSAGHVSADTLRSKYANESQESED